MFLKRWQKSRQDAARARAQTQSRALPVFAAKSNGVMWFEALEQRALFAIGTLGSVVDIAASTTANEASQAVGYASNGTSVVLYSQVQPPALAPRSLFVQRYASDGQAVGDAVQVNAGLLNVTNADMAVLPDGRFVVVWDVSASGNSDVYARLYNADATPVGAAFLVPDNSSLDQAIPEVAAAASGKFAVTWIDDASANSRGSLLRAQLFDWSGTRIGGTQQINPLPLQDGVGVEIFGPDIAMDADGDFAVGWIEERTLIDSDDGSLISNNVFGRRVSSSGQVQSSVTTIASLDTNLVTAFSVQMAMNAAGDFVVGYNDDLYRTVTLGNGDTSDEFVRSEIYYRSVSTSNVLTQPVAVELTDETYLIPSQGYRTWDLALDGDGNIVATWIINALTGSLAQNSVWMRRFNPLDEAIEPAFKVTAPDAVITSSVTASAYSSDSVDQIVAAYNSYGGSPARFNAVLRTVPIQTDTPPDPNGPNLTIDLTSVLLGKLNAATTPLIPGDKLTVNYSLSNTSPANQLIKGKVTLNFYLSEDDTLDKFDTALLTKPLIKSLNLKAGVTKLFKSTVKLPANVAPGSKRIIVALSDATVLPSSNRTDNVDKSDALAMVWKFGQLGERKGVKLTLNDADGTLVSFTMPGAGTGQVVQGDDWSVILTGTNSLSAATISTKKTKTLGDDGKVVLSGVTTSTVDGAVGPLGLKSLSAKTAILEGNLTSASSLGIGSITFGEIRSGTWNVTGALGTISIGGNADQWTLHAPQVGTIKVKGLLDDSHIGLSNVGVVLGDTLKSMSVGAIRDSFVFAGITNPDSFTTLPTAGDFTGGSIGSFTVKGAGKTLPVGVTSGFIRSFVAAATLGTVKLTSVQLDTGSGTEFGVVATTLIKSYSRTGIVTLKNLTTPNAGSEDYDPATNVLYVVRILPQIVG